MCMRFHFGEMSYPHIYYAHIETAATAASQHIYEEKWMTHKGGQSNKMFHNDESFEFLALQSCFMRENKEERKIN